VAEAANRAPALIYWLTSATGTLTASSAVLAFGGFVSAGGEMEIAFSWIGYVISFPVALLPAERTIFLAEGFIETQTQRRSLTCYQICVC
jgi:hypothetical protein